MGSSGTKNITHIADGIDAFLKAEKELAGEFQWLVGNREGEQVGSFALLKGGEITDSSLEVIAYPSTSTDRGAECRFKILLCVHRCVWRIDFDPSDKFHINPADRSELIGEGIVYGPHYHAWSDNKHLATATVLPKKLTCARTLPLQVRRWEQAFRWFCGETGIVLGDMTIPRLPEREELF